MGYMTCAHTSVDPHAHAGKHTIFTNTHNSARPPALGAATTRKGIRKYIPAVDSLHFSFFIKNERLLLDKNRNCSAENTF